MILFNFFRLLFFEFPYIVLNTCGFDRRNNRYRNYTKRIKRFTRHFFSVSIDKAFPNSPKLRLPINHYSMYTDEFAHINDEIQTLTGLDLEFYGYVTSGNRDQFLKERELFLK